MAAGGRGARPPLHLVGRRRPRRPRALVRLGEHRPVCRAWRRRPAGLHLPAARERGMAGARGRASGAAAGDALRTCCRRPPSGRRGSPMGRSGRAATAARAGVPAGCRAARSLDRTRSPPRAPETRNTFDGARRVRKLDRSPRGLNRRATELMVHARANIRKLGGGTSVLRGALVFRAARFGNIGTESLDGVAALLGQLDRARAAADGNPCALWVPKIRSVV